MWVLICSAGPFFPALHVQIISHFTVMKDEATGASCAAGTDLVSTVYPLRTENRPAGDSHGEHQHGGNPLPSICVETSIKLPVGHFSKVKIIWQLQPVQLGWAAGVIFQRATVRRYINGAAWRRWGSHPTASRCSFIWRKFHPGWLMTWKWSLERAKSQQPINHWLILPDPSR